MRPELAPHYILNVKSNYELGPGTSMDQRETQEIIAKIDFKQLEEQHGIQVPGEQRQSYNSVATSNGTEGGGPGFNYSFHLDENEKNNEQLRNFKPAILNKNVS